MSLGVAVIGCGLIGRVHSTAVQGLAEAGPIDARLVVRPCSTASLAFIREGRPEVP